MIGYERDDDKRDYVNDITDTQLEAYKIFPEAVRTLCWNYGGIVVGGFVKYLTGEVKTYRDIDVIIPLHKWPEACRMIPTGSLSNTFGGFKFKQRGVEVDVWPGDVLQTLIEQYPKGIKAYSPKTGLLITLGVV